MSTIWKQKAFIFGRYGPDFSYTYQQIKTINSLATLADKAYFWLASIVGLAAIYAPACPRGAAFAFAYPILLMLGYLGLFSTARRSIPQIFQMTPHGFGVSSALPGAKRSQDLSP